MQEASKTYHKKSFFRFWPKLSSLFACAIVFAFAATSLSASGADTVRVRLAKDLRTVKLSGVNLKFRHDAKIDPYSRVAIPRLSQAKVILSKLKSEAEPFWTVKVDDRKDSEINVFAKDLYISGSRIRVGLEPVPSRIKLVVNRRGKIDVITELDIESYLAGVLPSEMPASWPLEALKAQAVASRTYMRKKMSERGHIHFDLESSVHDQVYKAMQLKTGNPVFQAKVSRALTETRGQVLFNRRGDYLTAYYHADCGGKTETPQAVWGMDGPDHQIVTDRYCKNRKASLWKAKFSIRVVAEKLARHFKLYSGPKLANLFLSKKSAGGRVGELTVMFKGHLPKTINSQDLRAILGFDKIKSTQFTMNVNSEQVQFRGKGNGHGVGMCQWGSRQLAIVGKNYRQILKHYYPKAELRTEENKSQGPLGAPQLSEDWSKQKRAKSL